MFKKHRELTEGFLFNYFMISSIAENNVFCPVPFYIDRYSFESLKECSEVLDKLVMKVLTSINSEHSKFKAYMDDFQFRDKILSLSSKPVPAFWTRFDGFKKAGGGIFFSEFNYDKPCAQREIIESSYLKPKNDPNIDFVKSLKEKFKAIVTERFNASEGIKVAMLIDPCHYEEHHLSHLFIDLLGDEFEIIPAGPKNFRVQEDKVYVFDKEIQVILRLFPTEFLYEVNDFEQILTLFDCGKVLLLNDPRVIICQAKSLFAYLWELTESNSPLLTDIEKQAVKESLPYTIMFNQALTEELKNNRNKYVIKSVFGRYSEEVYIGKLCTEVEWGLILKHVLESSKLHIVQEFCEIHKEATSYVAAMDKYGDCEAYANFGIFLISGDFSGICIRWSEDYLTKDDTTWITPVGIAEDRFKVKDYFQSIERKKLWKEIYSEALEDYDFTGGYTGDREYFSLSSIIVDEALSEEICEASEKLCLILKEVRKLIMEKKELFFQVLGIDERLKELVGATHTEALCCIGRFDWVIDHKGELKVLEFNAETPAGLLESTALNGIIQKKLGIQYENPNENMAKQIRESFHSIVKDYEKIKPIKNIALLSSTYYEDWYTTITLYNIVKELPYNFIMGSIDDAQVHDNKLQLYGNEIDAVYRYYPLDWFLEEGKEAFIDAFANNTLSINPPHTFILQSKAIFALIYELAKQGYFTHEEREVIYKYIPESALSKEDLNTNSYVVKPLFGREGEGVHFNSDVYSLIKDNILFQERVYIKAVDLKTYSAIKSSDEIIYPVFGAFVAKDNYCGLYVRGGSLITDRFAVNLPVFVHSKKSK
jgi:glutathionylspermidine synthase